MTTMSEHTASSGTRNVRDASNTAVRPVRESLGAARPAQSQGIDEVCSAHNESATVAHSSSSATARPTCATAKQLAHKLMQTHHLSVDEYEALITFFAGENLRGGAPQNMAVADQNAAAQSSATTASQQLANQSHAATVVQHSAAHHSAAQHLADALATEARRIREELYGTDVYIRGLIEISNYCKNDCLYCGIRKSNTECERYRLTEQDILDCADEGYTLDFRTFVLQGGEDPYFTDERLVCLLSALKSVHPDCAITLSLGERSRESYQALFDAGADRYLLRHETVCEPLYAKLHPATMSMQHRLQCLQDLREIGYAVGCGFMVGAPFQTARDLAHDLAVIESFQPEMVGIGPFIPHHATPFRQEPAGSVELTCFLLSIIRLINPSVLLPATTALGSLRPDGRTLGMLAGANVVMPNLSPLTVRKKYELYNNKAHTGTEAAEHLSLLDADMNAIGYHVVVSRGDPKGR